MDGSISIGCAGWSIPATAAHEFPSTGSHLTRYAARLSAVEINTSFYRPHRPTTYQRWAATVPDGFHFAVKMPRRITHELRLQSAAEPVDRFLSECQHLGEKLGPILVQLPPSLKFEPALAAQFWDDLRERFAGRIVCEPRHRSWFTEPVEQMFANFDITRVAADPEPVPGAGLPGGNAQLVYYRLHGSPRMYYSTYDLAYLKQLAITLRRLRGSGVETWCIFDNTAAGAAASNALELQQHLSTPPHESGLLTPRGALT